MNGIPGIGPSPGLMQNKMPNRMGAAMKNRIRPKLRIMGNKLRMNKPKLPSIGLTKNRV